MKQSTGVRVALSAFVLVAIATGFLLLLAIFMRASTRESSAKPVIVPAPAEDSIPAPLSAPARRHPRAIRVVSSAPRFQTRTGQAIPADRINPTTNAVAVEDLFYVDKATAKHVDAVVREHAEALFDCSPAERSSDVSRRVLATVVLDLVSRDGLGTIEADGFLWTDEPFTAGVQACLADRFGEIEYPTEWDYDLRIEYPLMLWMTR